MKKTADEVLSVLLKYLGTEEKPANSNNTIFGKYFKKNGQPWCAMYLNYGFIKAGAKELFCFGRNSSYVPEIYTAYKHYDRLTGNGKKGDLVFFDFDHTGTPEHIGILLKKNTDGSYTCLEGNTSVSSNDNGGKVMKRKRFKYQILAFGRPRYKITFSMVAPLKYGSKNAYVGKCKKLLHAKGYKNLNLTKNLNVFGEGTKKAVTSFQKKNKIKCKKYGEIDAITYKKICSKLTK